MTTTFASRDRTVLSLNLAGATACAAVAALFFLAGLRPVLGRAAAVTIARHRLAAAVQQRDASEAAVRAGAAELKQLRQQTATTALVLLPPDRVNDALARVAAVSAGCGVQLDDVHVGKLALGERYATLPVHATGRGTYADCVRFLHRLNHDCPDVGVATFALAGTPGGAAGAPVHVDLELRWHAALPER